MAQNEEVKVEETTTSTQEEVNTSNIRPWI